VQEPFDSPEHRFEVKWDGTRSLCLIEGGAYRLRNRRGDDQTARYPELSFLAGLPRGLALDGELVVLADGRPSFHGMLEREQARDARKAAHKARLLPAVYVVFDLLYRDYVPRLERPLADRVDELREVVESVADPRLVFSDGVVGEGTAFFDGIRARAIEGMVAKRLKSPYQPGRRTDAWLKIKQAQTVHCVVLGWERDEEDGVRSLIVAIEEAGALRCVGKVGSGLDEALRARLRRELPLRARPAPLIPCPGVRGEWIEPGLFCTVSYLERTSDGNLRAPVFRELFEDGRWSQDVQQPGPS
jgi:DNA ligase D-like protein (predicted ligase)